MDPLAREFPWNSPYAFSENRLIDAVELEGRESFLIIQNWDANGLVKSINVVSYVDVNNNIVNMNLVDAQGRSLSGANTVIVNRNAPNGVPQVQQFTRLNNGSGNYGLLYNNAAYSSPNPNGTDQVLQPRSLTEPTAGLIGAGADGVLQSQNGLAQADQTVPVTRNSFTLIRRSTFNYTFPVVSAVIPNTPNLNQQIQDVSLYLSIFPNRTATVTGNSTSPGTSVAGGGSIGARVFFDRNGNFRTNGTVQQLKNERANAFGARVNTLGAGVITPRQLNITASPPDNTSSRGVTITYN